MSNNPIDVHVGSKVCQRRNLLAEIGLAHTETKTALAHPGANMSVDRIARQKFSLKDCAIKQSL